MFLKSFPDYAWLKKQSEEAFKNTALPGQKAANTTGWPIVILNTHTQQCDRKDLKGPFSIFTNISGTSRVTVSNKTVQVAEDTFFITNKAQYYTLQVDSTSPVETFNLHLGQDVWETYVYAATTPATHLLDNPNSTAFGALPDFPNLLQHKSAHVRQALQQLHWLSTEAKLSPMQLQEELVPLFRALMQQRHDLQQQVQRIPQLKAGTRTELFRRISLATDYVLSQPEAQFSLDELAGIACLSKFHFLRIFSCVHRLTPHQYILQQKLLRSWHLLTGSRLPIGDIALCSGFTEFSSYSRAFRKYMGCSPQYFRLHTN